MVSRSDMTLTQKPTDNDQARALTKKAAQESIDKEIAVLKGTIRTLKERRNTHSAVFSLHDEILSLVFQEVQVVAPKGWFRINKVCTHWRTVALNTPQLWTKLKLNHYNIDQAITQLQRAKSAPLDISCILPEPMCDSDKFWSFVAGLTSPKHAIRSLNLTDETDDVDAVTQFLISDSVYSQASSLEDIQIWASCEKGGADLLGKWDELPKLRSLTLSFPLLIKLPCIPRLTRLLFFPWKRVSISAVRHIFESMPLLEEVHITRVSKDSDALPTAPIPLPALRHLTLSFNDAPSSRFFASLHFPESTSVSVSFEYPPIKPSDVPHVCALVARLYETMRPPSIGTLKLKLRFKNVIFRISFVPGHDDGERSLIFCHNNQMMDFLPLLDAFPAHVFASLVCSVDGHVEFMDVLLPRLSHLTHLTLVSGSQWIMLCKLLKSKANTSVPIPELQSLTCDLNSRNNLGFLEQVLSERRGLGIPLQTIAALKSNNEWEVSHLPGQYGVKLRFIPDLDFKSA